MKQFVFAVALLAALFFSVFGASLARAEEAEEEKPCLLEADIVRDIAELVNRFARRAKERSVAFPEEEQEKLRGELMKSLREVLEPDYAVVKTPAECATYFPSHKLEDILLAKDPRLCLSIGVIEELIEERISELEKEVGFSWRSETARAELKERMVRSYEMLFLKRGVLVLEGECPKKE